MFITCLKIYTEENFDEWNFTTEGINITFKDYQLGAYAYGNPTVTIPYYEIKNLLKPEFLAKLQ